MTTVLLIMAGVFVTLVMTTMDKDEDDEDDEDEEDTPTLPPRWETHHEN